MVWRLLLAFVHISILFSLALAALAWWLYSEYSKDLPDVHELGLHRPFETTRIYARDGQTLLYEMVDPQGGQRTLVSLDRIPSMLREATLAVEDAHFYEHPGVDLHGVLRAIFLNYRAQSIVSGGSTITQQLVRNVLLSPEERRRDVSEEQLYERKVREIILAYQVNQAYSKDEILELYLNEVYYGARSYGVEAAAQTYFGKHVWELSDGEATLLAGLPQSPTIFNPRTNMKGARSRQNITLGLMVKHHFLTPGQRDAIYAQPVTVVTPTTRLKAPHFVFYVRDLLEQHYASSLLYHEGLRITTSIDLHWQAEAQRIVQHHIAELQHRNAHNAAVVMLSPEGNILAMVGSVDYSDTEHGGKFNVATAPRQPGSALKPIVYAAAFQRGWNPATIIWDVPTSFENNGVVYEPQNYDNSFHGPQRVRMALANSLNIPAVKTLEFVGIDQFVSLAKHMGITTFNDRSHYGLSMALGSNEVRLLDLTAAYNTFRNGGHYQHPAAILRIETNHGETLEQQAPELEPQVLGPHGRQIAFLITHILSDNEARWYMFGRGNVMELPDGRPAAVKTGTSNDWRDSWAIGYTPDITIGVWVGNNDNSPMHEVAGSNGAGLIWRDLMLAYHQGQPVKPFHPPPGVVQRDICTITGTLADPACPHIITEWFVEGMEPSPMPVTYQTVRVAGDGSCLAAPYTPPEEAYDAEFPIYPPEFRDLARQHGVPQPPDQLCPPANPDQSILQLLPINDTGEVAGNQVFIHGTAQNSFTLEVGQGQNPQTWTLLMQGGGGVENGLLGVWDTTGFEPGEYTIRVRMMLTNGRMVEARQVVWYK
jgi:1A family penicillin-binding protein